VFISRPFVGVIGYEAISNAVAAATVLGLATLAARATAIALAQFQATFSLVVALVRF
jgi:hypothetical protein